MGFFSKKKKQYETLNDIKVNKNLKVGLALGGGGARGFAHIGALKAFEESGIIFNEVCGTSVGSLVGAFYCAGIKADKMYELSKTLKEKDIRSSKLGIMPSKTEGIEEFVEKNLEQHNIEELPIKFTAVATDLKTTNEIHLTSGSISKAVAGSCAVPGVFTPVIFDKYLLVDGGLRNTIPADVLKENGCDFVVVIDINSARTYGTDSSKVTDVLAASVRILMDHNAKSGYEYGDVIIKPDLKKYKSTKIDGFDEMVEEGYRVAKLHIKEILDLFTQKPKRKRMRLSRESR